MEPGIGVNMAAVKVIVVTRRVMGHQIVVPVAVPAAVGSPVRVLVMINTVIVERRAMINGTATEAAVTMSVAMPMPMTTVSPAARLSFRGTADGDQGQYGQCRENPDLASKL
jgi:hypothetical protein